MIIELRRPIQSWWSYKVPCSTAFLLCFTLLSISVSESASIRGVDPSLQPHYKPDSGKFSCIDGSATFGFDRVNDNYCDCPADGSDEPGSSACVAGHFYCQNRGHQPLLLNSSFVDDGICDCCDGSDESSGTCKNACAEAGAANRAALAAKAAAFSAGLRAREGYVVEAVGSRQRWEKDVGRLAAEEAEQTRLVNKLKAKKERIEAKEAQERAREEAERKAREEEESARKAAEEALKPPESPPTIPAEDSIATSAEVSEGTEQPIEAAPAVEAEEDPAETLSEAEETAIDSLDAGEGEEGEEEELSEEEKGRRIAAQWTHDPNAVGGEVLDPEAAEGLVEDAQNLQPPPLPHYEVPADLQADVQTDAAPQDAEEIPTEPQGLLLKSKSWLYAKLGWDFDASGATSQYRQKIKDDYFAQNTRLNEITRQKDELATKLKLDFGPDNVFVALVDKCLEANVDKYVYRVCPFRSAEQKDGGMSTQLGSWKEFRDGYRTMVFEGGQQCWNGPPRSIKVSLECGAKEELSHVEEPSRCEYSAQLVTPAACSPEEAQAIDAQAKAAARELQEVKDEL